MSDFTPRANLRLPGGGSTGTILPDEQVDIDVLNDNFRKIDALLGARTVPSASSYSGSMDGDLVYARDTKLLSIYDANSTGLVDPRVAGGTRFKGTQAQMAAFTGAEDGDSFFNTTDNIEYVRLGGAWAVRNLSLRALKTSGSISGITANTPIPGLSLAFTLASAATLDVTVSVNGYGTAADTVAQVQLLDGGVAISRWNFKANSGGTATYQAWTFTTSLPFSASSHSLSLSMLRAGGSGGYTITPNLEEPTSIIVRS